MKNIKERTDIQQAYLDGESIEYGQYDSDSFKSSIGEPAFNWFECDYRIKPKPMEVWVITDRELTDDVNIYYKDAKSALQHNRFLEKGVLRKFIEVVD